MSKDRVGKISKPPHSAALPPLRRLLSVAYHRTCDAPVAKWWLDGREGQKTAICGALDISAVAEFELQLPLLFFRLSQFFDPRLYLLYCLKHSAIKDLNIAFSGDMRFRVTQDALYDFVLGTDFIQVRRKSPSESVPTEPRQTDGLYDLPPVFGPVIM